MVGIASICLCAASVDEKRAGDVRTRVAARFVTGMNGAMQTVLKIVVMSMHLPEIEDWSTLGAIQLGALMHGFGLRLRRA
jgi:hypothetical protein